MPHFEINEPARDDIAEIINRIAIDNPRAAQRVYDAMYKAFRALADFPGMGAQFEDWENEFAGLRYWPLKKYRNYLVIYGQIDDGIEVVRVLHAARDVTRVLRRQRPR